MASSLSDIDEDGDIIQFRAQGEIRPYEFEPVVVRIDDQQQQKTGSPVSTLPALAIAVNRWEL
jgi:hypothetical protein